MKAKIVIIGMLIVNACFGQDGVSSGSYSMVSSNSMNSHKESGAFNDRMIIVEDFVNYHKHKINIPKKNEVALSIDYDSDLLESKNSFVLQVGIATIAKENMAKTLKDVNVSLVIDNSGSMGGTKINYVKNAVKTFVKNLDNGVCLSLITFDNTARIEMNTVKLNFDREKIYQIIDSIQPGGSTNINAGMMLGYEEIAKTHNESVNSRLILLTDGMTNTGERNLEKILLNSKHYNDMGIEISTIGVGNSIDFDLLRSLSETGKGSNHFIGDSESDIQKVFVTELESLLYNIGKKTKVTIELPDNYAIKKIYGYKPNYNSEQKVSIELENLNSGITEVILIEIEKKTSVKGEIKATLEYKKDENDITVEEAINFKPNVKNTNDEIAKNYAIALMAEALKQYASDYTKGQTPTKSSLQKALAFADKYTNIQDVDIKRTYDILKKI
ncbi:VWA domain-containing protein [Flavobacterium sp. LC2016-01]|uniref:vWA domain-containing protein n=1 Tax=Flavobacterium sp. LC2016-01 TaxID=2675876 RepID=UPI0012BA7900|nr:VWA domain-containing protein [Flavobacterium sp. LC2016-01]MTH16867.1 VWA domain-containing protein [Flavobacterium sp. LC2016-01]